MLEDYWAAIDLVDREDTPTETTRARARAISAGDRSAEVLFALAHVAQVLVARYAAAIGISTRDVLEEFRNEVVDGAADDIEQQIRIEQGD